MEDSSISDETYPEVRIANQKTPLEYVKIEQISRLQANATNTALSFQLLIVNLISLRIHP